MTHYVAGIFLLLTILLTTGCSNTPLRVSDYKLKIPNTNINNCNESEKPANSGRCQSPCDHCSVAICDKTRGWIVVPLAQPDGCNDRDAIMCPTLSTLGLEDTSGLSRACPEGCSVCY